MDSMARLKSVQEMAKERGGKCLSKKYVNSRKHLVFLCRQGHKWKATPESLAQGSWCQKCAFKSTAQKNSYTIEDMQDVALRMGGSCLSKEYKGIQGDLKWRCERGHIFNKRATYVVSGKWCPDCSGAPKKTTIEDLHQLAKQRGGKCHSTKVATGRDYVLWECSEGHKWKAWPEAIKRGGWCRKCSIKSRSRSQMLSIETMKEIAKRRGGKCIDTIYRGANLKIKWECAEGHQWSSTPASVKNGTWCPTCSKNNLGERIVRTVFESMFGVRFSHAFPKWLVNTNGRVMELDGYNEELSLAFEHHGKQHYSRVEFFHLNDGDFEKRKRDDRAKKRICKTRGITLIEIPQVGSKVKIDDLPDYILQRTPRAIRPKIDDFDQFWKDMDWREVYSPSTRRQYDELSVLAKQNGGELVSKRYLGSTVPLTWRCSAGHEWEAPPPRVKSGTWCKKCRLRESGLRARDKTDSILTELISKKGGSFSSTRSIDRPNMISIKCKAGHAWRANRHSILAGSWCPHCAGIAPVEFAVIDEIVQKLGGKIRNPKNYRSGSSRITVTCKNGHSWETTGLNLKSGAWCRSCTGLAKKTIEVFVNIARDRGGECLSKTYVNSKSKLKFRCKNGHIWNSIGSSILRGHWCRMCAADVSGRTRMAKIDQFKKIATNNGGKCISTKYSGAHAKLQWECKFGHRWRSTPNSVKRGTWCPTCAVVVNGHRKRSSITDMQEIAALRGGFCLSKKYVNAHSKLKWECRLGHRWEGTPNNIKNGRWCPTCRQKTS